MKLHADLYPRGLPLERHQKVGHAGRGSLLGDAHWGLGWAAADGEVSLAVVVHRLRCAGRVLRFQIIWQRRVGFELSVAGDVYPVAALVRERFHAQLSIPSMRPLAQRYGWRRLVGSPYYAWLFPSARIIRQAGYRSAFKPCRRPARHNFRTCTCPVVRRDGSLLENADVHRTFSIYWSTWEQDLA